ncbi:hypothetical protein ACLO87_14805 [Paenalcaligenes sp. Me52]|uniref:hypothetical protein n=1 Tax=Paenalcaligenes sp. Me52 TaxID=3392038 RepID=UPI003D2D73BA
MHTLASTGSLFRHPRSNNASSYSPATSSPLTASSSHHLLLTCPIFLPAGFLIPHCHPPDLLRSALIA